MDPELAAALAASAREEEERRLQQQQQQQRMGHDSGASWYRGGTADVTDPELAAAIAASLQSAHGNGVGRSGGSHGGGVWQRTSDGVAQPRR